MDGVILSIKVNGRACRSTEKNARRGKKSRIRCQEKVRWRSQMSQNKVFLVGINYSFMIMGENKNIQKWNLSYGYINQRWKKRSFIDITMNGE